jgi:hypothetical protein
MIREITANRAGQNERSESEIFWHADNKSCDTHRTWKWQRRLGHWYSPARHPEDHIPNNGCYESLKNVKHKIVTHLTVVSLTNELSGFCEGSLASCLACSTSLLILLWHSSIPSIWNEKQLLQTRTHSLRRTDNELDMRPCVSFVHRLVFWKNTLVWTLKCKCIPKQHSW